MWPSPFRTISSMVQRDQGRQADEIAGLRQALAHRPQYPEALNHLGIALDVAAFTLGADWIERHFTLDRTWKGTDHAASLEPDGLRRVVRDLKAAAQALQFRPQEILPIEMETRQKLKWDRTKKT
jgi:N-acetylneuraminate synthase